MKRIIVLFNMLLFTFAMQAQEATESYRPFIEEGKVWVSYHSERFVYLRYCYFDGDTIINNRQCKKWIQKMVLKDTGEERYYQCALFEEDRKIWCFMDTATEPHLVYDFGGGAGDTIRVFHPDAEFWNEWKGWGYSLEQFLDRWTSDICITRTELVERNGWPLKETHYLSIPGSVDDEPFNYVWEGIGSCFGPLIWCAPFLTTIHELLLCVVGDKVLYLNEQRAKEEGISFPNAIRDIPAPMVNGKSSDGTWYDLSGRRLSVPSASSASSVLPPGVYIKDGKKVMVK